MTRRELFAPGLTLDDVWAVLAVALPAVAALAAPMSAVDLAYHVRAGGLMLDASDVLRTDPFTFTVGGQPWLDQQWLAQILFASLFRIGGWGAVAIAHGLLTGMIFGLLLRALRARGLPPRPAAWLTLAAFLVSLPSLAMRPQLLGVLLFAVLLYLAARGGALLLGAPLVALMWANVHGSFALAPATLGIAWLERAMRAPLSAPPLHRYRLHVLAGVSAVATLVNPWGFEAWRYAVSLASNGEIGRIVTEWQRTTPLTYGGLTFYASVGAALLAVWQWKLRLSGSVLGLVAFAIVGAYAERATVWWALAAPWLLAPSLAATLGVRRRSRRSSPSETGTRAANLVVVGLVAALGVLAMPWPYRSLSGEVMPLLSDAPAPLSMSLVRSVPAGSRVLASQTWGSWLEFAAPGFPVFVDSRIELFPPNVWDDYLAVSAGAGTTEGILDRWRVDAVVVSSREQPRLLALLLQLPGWETKASGELGSIFLRRPGG